MAEERDGVRAIQCKCYVPVARILKPNLDSFIASSAYYPLAAMGALRAKKRSNTA